MANCSVFCGSGFSRDFLAFAAKATPAEMVSKC